jgi:glycerol-3-phosphate dehydrogenase
MSNFSAHYNCDADTLLNYPFLNHMEKPEAFDVIVVGAGAAGIGVGAVLKELGLENFAILER